KSTRREFLSAAGPAMAGGLALAASSASVSGQDRSFPALTARRPMLAEVDVLVVGGGPAGIGAALGAARKGAKTLLIENHSFFGGVAAWSMGMQMNQMRPGGKPRSRIHELLIDKLKAYGDQAIRLGGHEVWSNVEYLKVAVLDALDEAGCRYFVHVRAADAVVENNRVAGVVVATKRGLQTIRAKTVVDCSGDADVAFYAGAETMLEAGALMPMTLGLSLTNIDKTKARPADVEKAIHAARGKHPLVPSGFVEVKQVAHSVSWWINHAGTADLGRLDPTDVEQRTRAECFSRRQALQMVQALRESDHPALQQMEWSGAGPQVSVRESRRVKGVYVITEEDAMTGRTFDDAIAWRSGFLDLGGQKGGKYVKMKIHDVPYRAIVPEKLDGLLMAGRCISATHAGAAAGKSMGNCMATGHAAGVAGAICAKKNCLPRELKVAELQEALRADGVAFGVEDREQRTL
ncbi:MAG: FAD-dependent oxidoreductase, partial [Verrucomicrobia bacterium]|nr:FAD-dependent oxidoreductase [Verrucomicrobiota bacterium]